MINVLITGIGGGGIGEQIIKTLKISSLDLRLFGSDTTRLSKNISEVEKMFILKPAYSNSYCTDLINICLLNSINVIFPGSEPELKAISDNRGLFEDNNIFLPINPKKVIDICLDKVKTVDFLKNNGFDFPRSVQVKEEKDFDNVDFYPAVLKPSIGGSGSSNIMLAQNKDELVVFGNYLLKIYDEFIIQEYIGVPEHEYTIGVLMSMDGENINSIGLKRIITHGLGSKMKVKNRSNRPELGDQLVISSGISQGEIGKFPEITKICVDIAKKIGARSSINIQCRFFENKVYVFEINPRYSGTTYFRAMAGYNEQEILLKKHFKGIDYKIDQPFENCTILRGLVETKI